MAKRLWESEPNISDERNKYRIKIRRGGVFVVDEIIADTDVAKRAKSDLKRVIAIRNDYLAKLNQNLPLHNDERYVEVSTPPYLSF